MTLAELQTERLRLVAMTRATVRADAAKDGTLAGLLDVVVPVEWPPEHWEPPVYAFLERQFVESPEVAGWNRYVVLRGEPPTLIGTVNAFPKRADEAEAGYSILAPWQGRGFATEAMGAFVDELFCEDAVAAVSAQTYPHLMASRRVLEKCGFQWVGVGDEEGTIRFRQER